MPSTVGKRKRQITETIQANIISSGELSKSRNEDVQDVFRRHFETRFKPLSRHKKAIRTADEIVTDEDGTESEWEGLSEPEGMHMLRIQVSREETDLHRRQANRSHRTHRESDFFNNVEKRTQGFHGKFSVNF
jgi:hypothetical protein